ncbi:MAG: hypothetical protein KatS3mg013_0918 [Actinomycetota bacterium]|jgi:hypothetical protein|nr:MAG: hypothetical protein KatS3mg013_0918 [Actinomycetota bacterium]
MAGVLERTLLRLVARPDARAGRVAVVAPPDGEVGRSARAVVAGLDRIGFATPIDLLWPVEPRHLADLRAWRLGVVHLANEPERFADALRLAWSVPGLIALHELDLGRVIGRLQVEGDAVAIAAAREAAWAEDRRGTGAAATVAGIARRSRGIVVACEQDRAALEGLGCRTPIVVAPPPAEDPRTIRSARRRAARLRARATARGAGTLIVATPGEPRWERALVAARAGLGPGAEVVVLGDDAASTGPGVRVAARDPAERLGWLAAADIVVHLGEPREARSLVGAMQLGRPIVARARGAAADVDRGALVLVERSSELGAALAGLIADPGRAAALGRAAAAEAERSSRQERAARAWARAIAATAALVHDPTAHPMRRWAAALLDLGVDEGALARGWGLSYVRALRELRGQG